MIGLLSFISQIYHISQAIKAYSFFDSEFFITKNHELYI